MKNLELILATFSPVFNQRLSNSGQQVIVSEVAGDFDTVYAPEYLMAGSRVTLDKNADYTHIRQLIPYVLVRDINGLYAVYSRTPKSTEERLHGKMSLGFGGHIDAADFIYKADAPSVVDIQNTIVHSAMRELQEELGIEADNIHMPATPEQHVHWHLISREDAVGTVHLGLVFVLTVKDAAVLKLEPELNFVGWYSETQIKTGMEMELFEGWSRALIKHGLADVPHLQLP